MRYGRPYFNISDRMKSLCALNFIDYVIESDYPTAELNLKKLNLTYTAKVQNILNQKKIFLKICRKKFVKKINAQIRYTSGKIFSSSKLINSFSQNFNDEQKSFLKKIKKKYSFSDIEIYLKKYQILKLMF